MNRGETMKENVIIVVMQQVKEVQLESKKNSGLDGIRTHDVCDSGANVLPLSYKSRWELGQL